MLGENFTRGETVTALYLFLSKLLQKLICMYMGPPTHQTERNVYALDSFRSMPWVQAAFYTT